MVILAVQHSSDGVKRRLRNGMGYNAREQIPSEGAEP